MLEPWFQMLAGRNVNNVISPLDLPADKYPPIMTLEKFLQMGDAVVHYNYNDAMRMPSVIFEPTFMVADSMRRIFARLQPEIKFKAVQFFSADGDEKKPMPLYWIPYYPVSECFLHEKTKYVMGRTDAPILEAKYLEWMHLLVISLKGQLLWLASLTAAERFLQQGVTGIQLKQVQIM